MNNRLFSSILLLVMLVYFSAYGIYTGIRFFYSPYKTETAFMYTVADSYTTTALAIRDEQLITQRISDDDNIGYVREDGEVVVAGTVVASVFSDADQLIYRSQIKSCQNEIELLQKAQQTSQQFLAADALSDQVDDAVGEVIDAVAARSLGTLRDSRDKLQLTLGRYRVALGRDEDYSKRISYLEGRIGSLSKKLTQDHYDISVDKGGYFCSVTDGYEQLLTPDFEALTPDKYRRLIEGDDVPEESDRAGRIQIGHDWYLAVWVPKADTARFDTGAMVDVSLSVGGGVDIPASVHHIMYDEEQNAVVILKTNYISEPLIAMRRAEAEIRFKSYTGLRISPEAVRYDGMVEGVYVKNDKMITFKEIKRVYTDEDFILCLAADDLSEEDEEQSGYPPLSQFDEVIVEGTELYDGKVI